MSRQFGLMVTAAGLIAAAPALRAQPCQPYWTGLVAIPAPYTVNSAAVADDGSGPSLFISVLQSGLLEDVFQWTGRAWQNVSATLPPPAPGGSRYVRVLTLDDGAGPALYALGWGDGHGIVSWARRWNGAEWLATPPSLRPADGSALPIASADPGDGPHIYGTVGPYPNSRIARWDGSAWQPMSIPTQIGALRLLAIDLGGGPQLYAVGEFGDLGGGPTGGFARWTGSTWERPLSNLDHFSGVYDAAVYDDGTGQKLYVSSDAYLAGSSEQLDGLAVWDGQSWSNLGGPAGGPGSVYERGLLQVFDDGRGPALFILGAFGHYGGIEAHGIVRWDGNTLEPLGRGITNAGGVYAVVPCPDPRGPSMFFCGEGSSANAGTPAHIVQYVGCPSCYANCDTSTRAPSLNVNDFICFMTKFIQQDPYANCTNDAAIDVGDFVCFMGRFAAGCP